MKIINIVGIVIFLSILYHLIGKNNDEINILFGLSLVQGLLLFFIAAVTLGNGALLNYYYYKHFSFSIPLKEAVAIFIYRYFLNFLPFRSGSIATAVYLNNKHKIGYQNQIIIFGTIMFIGFFSQIIMGLLLVLYLLFNNLIMEYYVLTIFIILLIISVGILANSNKLEFIIPKIINEKIKTSINGLKSIRNNPGLISLTIIYYFLSIVLGSIKLYFIASFLDYDYLFTQICLLVVVTNISSIFSITPGNLGIKEIFSGLIMAQFGGDLSHGMFLSVIDRIVDLLTSAILWIFFSKHIFVGTIKN
jgi:uncharacterized membrane protein YbhN (UPF0104 family)